jgi:hypothetical protein
VRKFSIKLSRNKLLMLKERPGPIYVSMFNETHAAPARKCDSDGKFANTKT